MNPHDFNSLLIVGFGFIVFLMYINKSFTRPSGGSVEVTNTRSIQMAILGSIQSFDVREIRKASKINSKNEKPTCGRWIIIGLDPQIPYAHSDCWFNG